MFTSRLADSAGLAISPRTELRRLCSHGDPLDDVLFPAERSPRAHSRAAASAPAVCRRVLVQAAARPRQHGGIPHRVGWKVTHFVVQDDDDDDTDDEGAA